MTMNGSTGSFSISPGAPETVIQHYADQLADQGNWPGIIQSYIARGEIKEEMFTPEVIDGMIEYLEHNGVVEPADPVSILADQQYDEYFALAYDYARRNVADTTDPLSKAYGPSAKAGTKWDYSVRTFSDFESQGIIKSNILAAGAIDYIYELGERMGIFAICDSLMLRWASGEVDVVDATADKFYRYWKRRDDRSSAEERGMLYKRVLNKGGAQVLNRMVINEPYPELWNNCMTKVAEYITKTEKVDDGRNGLTSPVSRTPVYQTIRDLQYNLTEYCTGMAHKQAEEVYSQLTDALDLLSDPEVIAHFGGSRRKTMWTVIEQLSKSEMQRSIPIGPTLRVALDGNKCFQFIGAFDEGTVREEDSARS